VVHGRKRERKTGFTLIELLVVIAVIAILAALLLPALSRSKAQAQSTVCKNHLHEMGVALHMYVDDAQAYPFYFYQNPEQADVYGLDTQAGCQWFTALQPYYPMNWTNSAYHCPTYQGVLYSWGLPSCGSYSYNVFGCNGIIGPDSITQAAISGLEGLGGMLWPGGKTTPTHAEKDVLYPSATFAIMDTLASYEMPPYPGVGAHTSVWTIKIGSGLSGIDSCGCFSAIFPYEQLTVGNASPMPHDRSYNVVFCDDHVEPVLFTNLFNPAMTAMNWNIDHKIYGTNW
jgi:prepilin-type N-terminal cleavage/methylation domain-containing protein